tara:strand:- start:302 stop:502 length:201 start_codon:yes stop_codon:yes gene_type:complete
MNRNAKRISSSLRPNIDRVKGFILEAINKGKSFDVDGYVGKTALSEVRKLGYNIKYFRDECHYKAI